MRCFVVILFLCSTSQHEKNVKSCTSSSSNDYWAIFERFSLSALASLETSRWLFIIFCTISRVSKIENWCIFQALSVKSLASSEFVDPRTKAESFPNALLGWQMYEARDSRPFKTRAHESSLPVIKPSTHCRVVFCSEFYCHEMHNNVCDIK